MRNEPIMTEEEIEVELASPWKRIGACIINYIVMSIIILLSTITYVMMTDSKDLVLQYKLLIEHKTNTLSSEIIFLYVTVIISLLIFGIGQSILMSKTGQSIGKRLMNIKVIDIHGQNPGFIGTVLLREIVCLLIVKIILILLFFILTCFWEPNELSVIDTVSQNIFPAACTIMLFIKTTKRRTLQDYLAKTIVIET